MTHAFHHLLAAVGIYKAGEATTYQRRVAWLAVATVGCVCCHTHHHRRNQ